MKLTEFLESGDPRWLRLDELAGRARRRIERLSADEIREFTDLYRASSADLAIARRLFPNDPVVARLERLVVRGRGLLFDRVGRREAFGSFFAATYWRLVVERGRMMLLAAILLLVPATLGAIWALSDPHRLAAVVPPDFLWVRDATSTDQSYGTAGLIGFSTYVMSNNVRVTLLAFVGGISWGLFSGWLVAQNGLILGIVTGLAIDAGNWKVLVAALAAHGVIELTCVVIGGGAGLAMGRAMIRPGRLTRREALSEEAVASVQMVLGTIPWLVLAGVLEGFVSRTGTGWAPASIVGVTLGAVFWGLAWWRGRAVRREQPGQSRADRLARR